MIEAVKVPELQAFLYDETLNKITEWNIAKS
jgi:hypothetical protein